MEVRTIKGVGRDKWLKLKEIAAKKGVSMGDLLGSMISDFSNRGDVWDEILNVGRIISNKEAEELESEIKNLRKEKGFRI
ncbi:MAG: hypothetical protein Q8P57_02235 [Candidatus Pacearchaeota archaeon]|nr:hypothetical protein [Candidatus Pacearchaeota archaeon]